MGQSLVSELSSCTVSDDTAVARHPASEVIHSLTSFECTVSELKAYIAPLLSGRMHTSLKEAALSTFAPTLIAATSAKLYKQKSRDCESITTNQKDGNQYTGY